MTTTDLDDEDLFDPPAPTLLDRAVRFARAGMTVFPVRMPKKEPLPGYLWKTRSSHKINEVVEDLTNAIHDVGEEHLGIAWATGLDGYVAVDDDYGLPPELAELEAAPHAVNVTARGRHLVFRNPPGLVPGNGTSRFPVNGWGEVRGVGGYIVVAAADRPGFDIGQLPRIGPFPRPEWLTPAGESVTVATTAAVTAFVDEHATGTRPKDLDVVMRQLAEAHERNEGRHPSLVKYMAWAMRDARAGLYPASTAIEALHDWWLRVMDDPGRRDGPEFHHVMRWAIGAAKTEPEQKIDDRATKAAQRDAGGIFTSNGSIDHETGEIDYRHLPDEFWTARPVHAHIRQAAHSRARSADAVFTSVLARVAAFTHPCFALPPVVGAPAPLSMFGALVGAPGTGKSSSKAVASELIVCESDEVGDDLPLGSGEGLIEAYFDWVHDGTTNAKGTPVKVKRQIRYGLFVFLDEGEALAELGNRKGSTLMPMLRTAWTGAVLGTTNASNDTKRRLGKGTYALGMVIAFQPTLAADLLADAAGGTPQRFEWALATDPALPEVLPEWPGELAWTPPTPSRYSDIVFTNPIHVDDQIIATVRAAAIARTRGTDVVDELDAHADLARLKIAALLAILDGRQRVTVDDWDLAGIYRRTSCAVRAAVLAVVEYERRRAEEATTARHVAREGAVVEGHITKALERMARAIGRHVARGLCDGGCTRRCATQATAGRDRQTATIDEAIDRAVALKWITRDEGHIRPGEATPI